MKELANDITTGKTKCPLKLESPVSLESHDTAYASDDEEEAQASEDEGDNEEIAHLRRDLFQVTN